MNRPSSLLSSCMTCAVRYREGSVPKITVVGMCRLTGQENEKDVRVQVSLTSASLVKLRRLNSGDALCGSLCSLFFTCRACMPGHAFHARQFQLSMTAEWIRYWGGRQ